MKRKFLEFTEKLDRNDKRFDEYLTCVFVSLVTHTEGTSVLTKVIIQDSNCDTG